MLKALALLVALWVALDLFQIARCLRKSSRRKPGFIYFFSDKGQLIPTVKIGRAKDDKARAGVLDKVTELKRESLSVPRVATRSPLLYSYRRL